MKSYFLTILSFGLLFVSFFFVAHTVGKPLQNGSSIGFAKIEGFFLRPEMVPKTEFNTQIFARKEQFDQHFVTRPGKGKVSKLDFSKYIVVVCSSPKSTIETTLSLQKIIKKAGVFEIYFLAKYGKHIKLPVSSTCLYSTAIDKSLTGIVFYVNGKLVQDVRN